MKQKTDRANEVKSEIQLKNAIAKAGLYLRSHAPQDGSEPTMAWCIICELNNLLKASLDEKLKRKKMWAWVYKDSRNT